MVRFALCGQAPVSLDQFIDFWPCSRDKALASLMRRCFADMNSNAWHTDRVCPVPGISGGGVLDRFLILRKKKRNLYQVYAVRY